ncbi:MTH938/NDUFAF3 family protein [Pseudoxanthobacter sp.]|uniref:Mth938-like domain-containing protein n=1 Tax=Pseudoxanthobacter sp. TaxID=1925742 RepID=UPI002FE057A8
MAGIVIRQAHFPDRAPVDAYGDGGFRFAGMSHRGAILALPSGIHGWSPVSVADLDREAFAPVVAQAASFGFFLLGTGEKFAVLPPDLLWYLKGAGLRVEMMSTGAAVRTYNVMLSEERPVAAGFLPVF